ncbi:MAG: hypothetical protein U0929_03160 [Planctomycetaceae bacterium]
MADYGNQQSLTQTFSSLVGESLVEPHPSHKPTRLSFGFARQRWQSGLLLMLQASVLIGVGAFLLSEIPATPGLKVQMAILSVILIGGGLWMVPKIVVDFFGSIRVDQTGIHMEPTIVGFSTPWDQIERWEVRDCNGTMVSHCVRVWTKSSHHSHTIPAGYLCHRDLHLLRRVLLVASPSDLVTK